MGSMMTRVPTSDQRAADVRTRSRKPESESKSESESESEPESESESEPESVTDSVTGLEYGVLFVLAGFLAVGHGHGRLRLRLWPDDHAYDRVLRKRTDARMAAVVRVVAVVAQ